MGAKSTPTAERARRFRRALVRWFRRRGRDLPWRRTRDPWAVLVSEVMLQQTPVARVEAYYPRFLARFPTLGALAAASPRMVREQWEGLGYYRRADYLHRLARTVVRNGGVLPADPDALRRLPGVGRYTANAVACFAHQRAQPPIDTNIARVLRRAFHPRLGENAEAGRRLQRTAMMLQPRDGPAAWAFNQGLMEIGAVICTARVARCGRCPVVAFCSTGSRSLRR